MFMTLFYTECITIANKINIDRNTFTCIKYTNVMNGVSRNNKFWKQNKSLLWQFDMVLCIFLTLVLFIYFTLQRCIGFAIHWHESTMGVHVFPILNNPPHSSPSHHSGSSQCTSPKHPVSCIEPALAIHFTCDNLHVSMPFSHIIPPSPSPTESKRLFYTSVSLLLSFIQGYHYHLSKFHIYALIYCIGVFLSGLLHSV